MNQTSVTNICSLGHAEQSKGQCLVDLPIWVMDSGATQHFTFNKEDFITYSPRNDSFLQIPLSLPTMKKFGLIVPEKKKTGEIVKKVAVASIFNEEDDFEDDEEKELAALRRAKASENVTKSISSSNDFVEKIHQEALNEDPNIFDYDASIEEDSKRKNIHRNLRISGSLKGDDDEKNLKNEPKYMHNILAKAEERKIESELIKLRNMKRKSGANETGEEEEVFVTAAYKQRLKELEEKEKELKARQKREEDGDVTKRKDMSGFYYNLMKRNVSFGGKLVVENERIIESKKPKTEETEESPIQTTKQESDNDSEPEVFGPRRPPTKQ